MIDYIYIEEAVIDHPRSREIITRYPKATIVTCSRYSNVFNSNSQNFRLQKQQPSLILAEKNSGRVIATPEGYGIGGQENYYFSHMLNCLYDCRYCFLQGMYRSAHYVVFVNYEDFMTGTLLNTEAQPNCVVAYSFTPRKQAEALEHKVKIQIKRMKASQFFAPKVLAAHPFFEALSLCS